MIKLLLLIGVLITGVILAPELAGNQGYVLISVANQTIEMSFTTLVVAIIAGFSALFLLEFIIRKLFTMPSATAHWFSTRRAKSKRNDQHRSIKNDGRRLAPS